MHSDAKMASLQSIIDLMDELMLKKTKSRRPEAPAVVEMTIAAEPEGKEHKHSEADDLGDDDVRSLADLYSRDDDKPY